MYPDSTLPGLPRRIGLPFPVRALVLAAVVLAPTLAQSTSTPASPGMTRPVWRRIGNASLDLSLAATATGPVDRVWYSADGARLHALSQSGKLFETTDFDAWRESAASAPALPGSDLSATLPESSARVIRPEGASVRLYALGESAYRSDDGGITWSNLTSYRNRPILGEKLRDLAVSPQNQEEVAIAASTGVWRSLDGGQTWDGLNSSLPNLPTRKLTALPAGIQGVRLVVELNPANPQEVEWRPGEKQAWHPLPASPILDTERGARSVYSGLSGLPITTYAGAGSYLYLGSADGWLLASSDQGATWNRQRISGNGPVTSIWIEPAEPGTALAATASRTGSRILRTTNGGLFWDDLSANLPSAPAYAVAADWNSGTLYAGTEQGLFLTTGSLANPGPATTWTAVAGLPEAPVRDIKLDAGGNQLFVAVDGYGVYAAMAPHRYRDLRLVSAGDYRLRPAAPGSLLSVLGRNVASARSGDTPVPVLAASDAESQIQVPFEAVGTAFPLDLESAGGATSIGVALRRAAPAIFVDRDNSPLLLNADTGVLLDAMNPAPAGGRLQILATGLGGVKPDWPTGMPAPLENPPAVSLPVRVYLDRAPVEVARATLAPGYVGFYLIEVRVPEIVNAGASELYVEVDGQESNRVRVWLAP